MVTNAPQITTKQRAAKTACTAISLGQLMTLSVGAPRMQHADVCPCRELATVTLTVRLAAQTRQGRVETTALSAT